jgi:hypothetical protein
VQDLTAAVVPGQSYQGSAWATVGAPADGGAPSGQVIKMTVKYQCAGASGAMYTSIGSTAGGVLPGTWAQITGSFTTTCTTIAAGSKIEMYIEGPAAGIDLYVDDVVLH